MMGGHAERAHALLSASGAYQWMACTPSARLQEQFPDNPSGTAAAEGTLAHELAELKVRNYFYSVDFGKRKLMAAVNKLKKEELWDDEMTGYTDDYLDYIKAVAMKYPSSPYVAIEKRVDLSTYVPEGFGTADCILIGGDVLHVIDFKYGKSPDGRVTAEWNPQMLLYALGAYEMYRILYTFKTVRLSIVQPRLPDGISEWECTLDDMLQFGEFVKERAALAIKGEGEFAPAPKTCRYCRARGRCKARAEKNVELAFLVGTDWTDMDKAFSTLTSNGISDTILWERKPLSLAQVEKVVGKKDFQELVGGLVVKNPGKPALVEETDKRPAITNKVSAAEAFKEAGQ